MTSKNIICLLLISLLLASSAGCLAKDPAGASNPAVPKENLPDGFKLLAVLLMGLTFILQHQLGVVMNDGEKVVEIMGDASGELTHHFHCLCLMQLFLKPFAYGDVM